MMAKQVKKWMSIAGVIGAAAMAAVGCTSSTSSAPQSTSSVNASPSTSPSSVSSLSTTSSAAPATVSENNPCFGAQFTPPQFVGEWTEQGDTLVTTLAGDGTLNSHDGATTESGVWSYTPWEFTPAKDRMPDSAANQCVLWLRVTNPAPPTDLVYVPLKVTDTTMQMSYVGRGNTIVWLRSTGNS
jgi:hypothetical protein